MVDVPDSGAEKFDMPPTNDAVDANGAAETVAPLNGGIILDGSDDCVGFTIPVGCGIIGGTAASGWDGIMCGRVGPPIKFGTVGTAAGIGGIIPVGAAFSGAWDNNPPPPTLGKRGGIWFCIMDGCCIGALTSAGFGSGGIAGGDSAFRDARSCGGRTLGTSNPRSFKLINLQAMENSFISIFPSASVSASALKNYNDAVTIQFWCYYIQIYALYKYVYIILV